MKDRLKDFVQAHREEFDSFAPRPDLWQDIAAELQQEEKKPVIPIETEQEAKVISINWHTAWRYAAAVALLVMVAFSARYYMNTQGASEAVATTQPVPLDKIAPELRQIETKYVRVIEKKKSELKAMGAGQVRFAELDSAYNELKKELYTTPNKEVLLQAMSDNLKMRIALLNQQLEVLENRSNVKAPARHETTNI
ncbi:anti-sigma factor [Rufibacter hautae]|uniref:Anti-sigma factor n=1 Tax=Rufibacter hautae TaxID=2595005 RepID=A0A5B6T7X9_9BACT|nr:anti-sigma factor [Rufibacter hautae]KAA3436286.1 anti-sigma factor [Rufibacter hautae]